MGWWEDGVPCDQDDIAYCGRCRPKEAPTPAGTTDTNMASLRQGDSVGPRVGRAAATNAAPASADPPMYDPAAIDALESDLRIAMDGHRLVGMIDLDQFGPRCERALLESAAASDPARLRRLWPRVFVSYLVWQGLHNYEAATFWSRVSVPSLRDGGEVGPLYELALRDLGLPVFGDLEALEGFSKHTRGRYVRRIHLHGGIPRDSLPRVFDLVAATLRRSGARSAGEVLELWLSSGVMQSLPVAAARVLAYTGDFGTGLIEELVALLKEGGRGGDLSLVGAPSHFEQAARSFLLAGPSTHTWEFKTGPTIQIEPFAGLAPYLVVPPGRLEAWSVDEIELGHSSRQVDMRYPLGPPGTAGGWSVTSTDGSKRHFPGLGEHVVCALFDARGQLHRRGTTLRDLRAYALCPAGAEVSGEVERRHLGGEWSTHELVTLDLRGRQSVTISSASERIEVTVDASFSPRLAGHRTAGLSCGSLPAYGGSVGLVIDGVTPDPETVTVRLATRGTAVEFALSELDVLDEVYDLTNHLDQPYLERAEVEVILPGVASTALTFAWLPEVSISLPRVAGPTAPLDGVVHLPEDWHGPSTIHFGPEETQRDLRVDAADGVEIALTMRLNRLFWAIETPAAPVQVVHGDHLALHVDHLGHSTLVLRCIDVMPRLVVLGNAEQAVWLRSRQRGTDTVRQPLGMFADTVRTARDARCEVRVDNGDGTDSVLLGCIESRYEPVALEAAVEADGTAQRISAIWEEITEWDSRVARLWEGRKDGELVVEQPLESGARSVELVIEDVPPGRYLLEVTRATGWGAARHPGPGPGVIPLHLGSDAARRLRQAVHEGDARARFSDAELDELTPLLADVLGELLPDRGTPEQRSVITDLVLDDTPRAVDIVLELARHQEVDDFGRGGYLIEPSLVPLLPFLFDVPIRTGEWADDEHDRLTELWAVAPIIAACVDAGSAREDASADRWRYAAGQSLVGKNPLTVRDKLVRGLPTVLGEPNDLPQSLSLDAWTRGLIELRDASARTSQVRLGVQSRQLVQRIASGARWMGVTQRVQRRVKGVCLGAEWLVDLVGVSCGYLDRSTSPDKHRQILQLLLETHAVAPQAVRSSLVLAAGSMRVLDRLG